MTEVRDIKVYGLKESFVKSGFPMMTSYEEYLIDEVTIESDETDKLIKRCKKLASSKAGSGHDSFMKNIIVQFNIKYPEYLSPELQRYHWFEIVSSMSKMHRLTKLNIKDCVNKYVDKDIIHIVEFLIDQYNLNPTYENFMKVLSSSPLGLEKWMAITTNYLQLKTIFSQRKNHKLKEDWGAILKMIEELPMSELITGIKQ